MWIARPGAIRDGTRINRVLGNAIVVRQFPVKTAAEGLLQGGRQVPGVAHVLIFQHNGIFDHIALGIVDAVGGVTRPVIGAGIVRLCRRQVGIDVIHAIDILAVHEIHCSNQAPGQFLIDADVASPYLREFEIGIGQRQFITRCGGAGNRGRFVGFWIWIERPVIGIGQSLKTRQHTRIADLVGNPHVSRFAGENPRTAAHLGAAIAFDIPIEAKTRRPQDVRARQFVALVFDRIALFIAKSRRVGIDIFIARFLKKRHIQSQTGGQKHVLVNLPFILAIKTCVPDLERLHWFDLARNVTVTLLEHGQFDGRGGAVGIGQIIVGVGIKFRQRIVDISALRTREKDVFGLVAFQTGAKSQIVLGAIDGEIVLQLKSLVAQLVVRGEGLKPERRIHGAALPDVDHREQLTAGITALIVVGITDDEIVGHVCADQGVPFADDRANVLQNLVIGVLEIQAGRTAAAGTCAQ